MQQPIHESRRVLGFPLAFTIVLAPSIGSVQAHDPSAGVPQGLGAANWSGIRQACEASRLTTGTAQQAYLKASNTGMDDRFGTAVAVSGDTVVVGAFGEDSGATGVNGDPDDDSALASGAAYVFVRSGTTWTQQAYLKASNADPFDQFGSAVAVDGDTIVVGAQLEDSNATGVNGDQSDNGAGAAGAAYVFVRSGTTWTQQAYLKASNTDEFDFFGDSVAVSGHTVVVGARLEDSNASGVDGDQDDDGAEDAGAAYVFVRNGTTWTQQAYLKASNTDADDEFGQSVTMSGGTIVVGADGEASNADGVNGDQESDDTPNAGAAYVFTRSGSTWTQQAYLKASNSDFADRFGTSVGVSGDTVVVGAFGESSNATVVDGDQDNNIAFSSGAAYVFTRSGTTWTQQAYLKASNAEEGDLFGSSVAISGGTVLVGAQWEDSGATGVDGNQGNGLFGQFSGAAYVFARSGTTWTQEAYLKASNTDMDDLFGLAVALSCDTAVVGAINEDSGATGVNGDDSDDSVPDSGASYVFVLDTPDCVVLDFETEDDLVTPLVNGQDVSTPPEFGLLASIGASAVGPGAAIFDTDPNGPNQGPPFHDPDLLVDLGNVLILQETPGQTVTGIFDDPDDSSAGGTLFFDFTQPVQVCRIDLIDIDLYPAPQDAFVTLVDGDFDMRVYHAPSGWTEDIVIDGGPGYRTLDTTTLALQPGFVAVATAAQDPGFDPQDVIRMEVFLTSSGAADNLKICPQRPDPPPKGVRPRPVTPGEGSPR